MPFEVSAGALALIAVLLYAVLGGADFGGGVWDLFAAGTRGAQQREAIGAAMGPVWETNHVWLIYVLVLLFTCFPPVFAILGEKLFVPLTLALFGIVLRGAAFAFRGPANRELLPHKVWGVLFGIASLLTPFLFGASAAGIATGSFDWQAPMSDAVGIFAVALCSQLAAVYLAAETAGALREDFRMRAYIATAGVAVTGLIALAVAYVTQRALFVHLGAPLPEGIVVAAMLLGIEVVVLLRTGYARWARAAVALEVAAVMCGWYAAQAPYALQQLEVTHAAAPPVTLRIFVWTTLAGGIALVPSLALLFAVFKRKTFIAKKRSA
jgi:cytochrome d ubiquinol oxidase subunit II